MDNPYSTDPDSGSDTGTSAEPVPQAETPVEPVPELGTPTDIEPGSYVNEKIRRSYDRVKSELGQAKDYYQRSPKLQKVTYQGKFLPAFWTIACIFSLLVNVILIAALVSFGHHFFELKTLVSKGLVSGLSSNLALMDKAHLVTTVPVRTTVQLQDNVPLSFILPIRQNTLVVLAEDTAVSGTTLINLAPVPLDITLPAGTPIKVDFSLNVPVSETVPVDITVPISMTMPLDLAIDQTDLHQSIVGLQNTLEPYQGLLDSSFNSPKDISLCTNWWSGWMCSLFFGKP